jgi:hypothetical protein
MVSFVNSAVAGANLATIAPTWPSVLAGDTALLTWALQSTMTPTDPGAFVLDQTDNATTGAMTSRVYHRNCDGSETGSFNLTASGANRMSAALAVYRGCHLTSPIDTISVRNEGTSGTTHACPSVTTGFADCVVVTVISERSTTGTNGWTPPSGYTERADTTTLATGSGGTVTAIADDGLASGRSAGTVVTPPVWTSTNAFATANVVIWTISLRPLPVAGKNPQTISQYGSYF